jgi:hypothetical protein
MNQRIFIITVQDDPHRGDGQKRVILYDFDQGDELGTIDAPSEQHVPQAAAALFAGPGKFGHPEPPPLRDLPASSNGKLCAAVDGSGDLMWKPADVDRSQSPGA